MADRPGHSLSVSDYACPYQSIGCTPQDPREESAAALVERALTLGSTNAQTLHNGVNGRQCWRGPFERAALPPWTHSGDTRLTDPKTLDQPGKNCRSPAVPIAPTPETSTMAFAVFSPPRGPAELATTSVTPFASSRQPSISTWFSTELIHIVIHRRRDASYRDIASGWASSGVSPPAWLCSCNVSIPGPSDQQLFQRQESPPSSVQKCPEFPGQLTGNRGFRDHGGVCRVSLLELRIVSRETDTARRQQGVRRFPCTNSVASEISARGGIRL